MGGRDACMPRSTNTAHIGTSETTVCPTLTGPLHPPVMKLTPPRAHVRLQHLLPQATARTQKTKATSLTRWMTTSLSCWTGPKVRTRCKRARSTRMARPPPLELSARAAARVSAGLFSPRQPDAPLGRAPPPSRRALAWGDAARLGQVEGPLVSARHLANARVADSLQRCVRDNVPPERAGAPASRPNARWGHSL